MEQMNEYQQKMHDALKSDGIDFSASRSGGKVSFRSKKITGTLFITDCNNFTLTLGSSVKWVEYLVKIGLLV